MTISIPPFQFFSYRLICFVIFSLVISTAQAQVSRLTDIVSGTANSNPSGFFLSPSEDFLYFYASTAAGNSDPEWFRLKLSDNTVEQLTTDFAAGTGTIIGSAFRSGNNVFFASKKTGGRIQWGRLNLTNGTFSQFDISNGPSDANPSGGIATDENNNVYAMAGDGNFIQVFKWSPGTNTATKVSSFTTPIASALSGNGGIAYYNGYLYFPISTATGCPSNCTTSDNELGRYKLSDNTFSRYDVNPGTDGSSPQDLQIYNNKLFFIASTGGNRQVYTLDLSNTNSVPVKLTNFTATGSSGDVNGYLYDGTGKVYFYADGETDTQRNVYVADLTANTVTKLTAITTNSTFIGIRAIYNGYLYYTQHTTPGGSNASFNKLKLSDNSITSLTTTPQLVSTLAGNTTYGSQPVTLVIGTKLYFQGNSTDHGTELWQVDLTNDAVTRLSNINPSGNAAPTYFFKLPDNGFVFRASDGSTGIELYRYTPAAPTPVISTSGTLSAVSTTYGTASSTTNFSVSGANMTQGITVTPPAGFEVSLSSGSGYNTSITVGAAGTINATTVYVRLAANTVPGNYSGNVVLSSSGASNVNAATVSSTVTVKPLTVTGLTGANKTYDAFLTASVTGTATLSGGLVGSDAVTLNGPGTFNFNSPAKGSNKPITASGFTLTGAQASYYTLSQPANLSADIIAKGLTITGITANNKVYDGTTTTTLTGTATLNGVVNTDNGNVTLGGTPNVNFNDPGVGNNKPVTVTGYTISGTASSNYSLAQPSGLQANIISADPVITSFQPTSGDVNQLVTINGTNFLSATAVTIGGIAAKSFNVVDNNIITATTNDNFTTGFITVTKGTTATSATQFTRTPSCALIISNTVAVPVASVTDQPTCPTPTGTITVTYPTGANIRYSTNGTTFQANPVLAGLAPNATYTVTAKDNTTGCYTTLSNLVINAVPTGPTTPTGNASQIFCAGATVSNLTATGSAIKWYDAPTQGNLLTTSTLLTNGAVYYASQTVSNCESSGRLTVTATVNPAGVGGNISGSTNVCTGTNSTTLTLTEQIGNVLKWQSSLTSDFATANDITNTTTSFTATNLAQTTYYRAVIQSGVCSPVNSGNATVTVDPVSAGGSISGSATVCAGINSTVLTLTNKTGNVIKWQSSLTSDFASAIDITNTTTSLTVANLTQTTYYRAVVQSGVCLPANSANAIVTVDPVSAGGSIAGSNAVCSGTNSTVLTLSGQIGTILKWQSSLTSDFASATDIANTTTSFTATNLTQTTYYRAVVQSGVCLPINSANATVTVDAISAGGSISGSATVCSGANSTVLTLTGKTGNVIKWQSSLTADFASATDITNTTTSLTAINLTQTTYYRAVVQSGVCSPANSASATVTVDPISAGGSISGGATVCSGTNSTVLTLTGKTGNVIKWQSSLTSDFASATDIANTTISLTATNLTQTTYYRAVVQSGVCSSANSSNATVTVDPVSVGGSISGGTFVCSGINSTVLTLTGKTGNVIKWQSSLTADFASATDIANTTISFTATNLTQTTYYRAVVQSGVCSPANSASATITVDPISAGGSISGGATVCSGTNSTVLTLTGKTGNVIKWQSSLTADFASATDIANTTISFTATNLTQTTYYRAVVQNGVCLPTNSANATVTVDPISAGGSISGGTFVCSGINSTLLILSGQIGAIQKWQSSLTSDFASATDITNTTTSFTATNLTQTTYYRAVVQSGGCLPINSANAILTVDPISVGGSISGGATVCSGINSTVLTLTGKTGNVIKWQSSLTSDFASATDIANTTTSFTATNLTQTTYYRAVVQSGVCLPANSTNATVVVNPLPTAVISGTATVCQNTPAIITFTGSGGTIPYTFTYTVNGGTNQTITTVSGSSVVVTVPTSIGGTFIYSLVSVQDAGSTQCSQLQSTNAIITVLAPTIPVIEEDTVFLNGPLTLTAQGCSGQGYALLWYRSADNIPVTLPVSPTESTAYYAKCQQTANSVNCLSDKSATITVLVVQRIFVNASNINPTRDGNSWTTAFVDLKTGLSTAAASNYPLVEVWVAQGTYVPGTLRKDVFEIPTKVKVYGGFAGTESQLSQRNWKAHPTILSGEIGTAALNDNSHHVVLFRATDSITQLDGFIIQRGYAEFYAGNQNSDLNDPNLLSSGGGVLAIDKSRGLITNCIITDNRATAGGAMMLMDSSALKMTQTVVWGNEANFGGGIYVIGGSKPVFENVLVAANKGLGGGLYINQSQLMLNNCTIASNQGNGSAGGIFNTNGVTTVKNSIVWGNTSPQSTVESVISYSIVEGGYPGINNQSLNPRFVNPNAVGLVPLGSLGDYHLQACSPAINAGDNTNAPTIDLDGNARPFPTGIGIVDIGVYESQSAGSSGPNHVTVTESITGSTVLKAGGFITATNQVSNATVVYQGTNSVTLLPGFSVTGNSFQAIIGGCETN